MKKSLLLRLVFVIVAIVGLSFSAIAQVTTSSMTGTIKDAKGALPGASVKATHTPTGTVYSVSTNGDGRFTIGGMRVGGPYTVEISFVGYNPQKQSEIYLKLGEPYALNIILADNSSTLAEVKVVGQSANSILNSNKNGSSTVIGKQQIQTLPTITRSVNDLTRLTPQGGGPNGAIGGGNYRSNNFTVDGANFNNQFGIGQNIPAGGSISAVTRSGTNKFSGNAFYTMRGDDQQGRRIGDTYRLPTVQPLDEKNYGFSLGGPIVKDKLFFFVNYEKKITTSPGTQRIAANASTPYSVDFPNVVPASETFLNDVSSYLLNRYGYATGPYQGYSQKSENEKMFARLDWNITKNHNFSIRYNQVESKSPASASTSTSGSPIGSVTNYAYANVRASGTARDAGLPFANSNYYQAANLYSAVAELNSSFGSKFTNTLRGTYSHQNDPRTSDSSPFPLVDILDGSPTGTNNLGRVLTTFGYEPFTYGNLRDVKSYTISDELTASLGKHNITLGAQLENSTTKNGFQRFGTGFYTFRTWNDFINNQRPAQYTVTYPLTADGSQAFPSFKFAQYSAYIQDEFTVSDRLKLTAGLRVEQQRYPDADEVRTHPLVAGLTFAEGRRVDTGVLPENRISYSPRFGFNWDVVGDRSFQVRGGTGIFTGRIPFVWIVSQSGDAGLIQYTQSYVGNDAPLFSPSIAPQLSTTAPPAGSSLPSSGVSAMSPDLKFPQTWKSSLAFDFKLPGGIVATVEGIYGKDLNVAVAKNVNLVDPTIRINNYPDTRPFYPSANTSKYINPINSAGLPVQNGTNNANAFNTIVMTNAKGGYNWMATAQLTKQFSNGISAMIAYTKSEQKNYGDQGGDQLLNLFSIPATSGNPNVPSLSYSSNLNPDRIVASFSYRKEYLKNLATTLSVFYEGANQGRFSYTYNGDFNRDGISGNDLMYIPANPSEITFSGNLVTGGVTYTPQQQSDIFFSYIEQDKYLRENKGKFAERNGAVLPWRNQFDLRLVQEVFRNVGGSKNSFQFIADIFNFGNLLNRKWGNVNFNNSTSLLAPQNTPTIGGNTTPTFRLNPISNAVVRETFGVTRTTASTYYMQFGVRYNFN